MPNDRVKAIDRLKSPSLPMEGNSSKRKFTVTGSLPFFSRRAYASKRENSMVKNNEDKNV